MKMLLLMLSILTGCRSSSSIQKETQNRIVSQKNFMQRLAFKGKVVSKDFCDTCNFNRYQVTIAIEQLSPTTIGMGNIMFQPYYYFDSGTKKLTLSITETLYNEALYRAMAEKIPGQVNVIINGKSCRLLSEHKYKWVPD